MDAEGPPVHPSLEQRFDMHVHLGRDARDEGHPDLEILHFVDHALRLVIKGDPPTFDLDVVDGESQRLARRLGRGRRGQRLVDQVLPVVATVGAPANHHPGPVEAHFPKHRPATKQRLEFHIRVEPIEPQSLAAPCRFADAQTRHRGREGKGIDAHALHLYRPVKLGRQRFLRRLAHPGRRHQKAEHRNDGNDNQDGN